MHKVFVKFRYFNGPLREFRDEVPGPTGEDFDWDVVLRLGRQVIAGLTNLGPPIVDTERGEPAKSRGMSLKEASKYHGFDIFEATVDGEPYNLF